MFPLSDDWSARDTQFLTQIQASAQQTSAYSTCPIIIIIII